MRDIRNALSALVVIVALTGCGASGTELPAREANRGYMGLEGVSVRSQAVRLLHLRVSRGLLVYCIRPGLAADRGGLRAGHFVLFGKTYWPVGGDQIVAVDGTPLVDRAHLFRILGGTHPGDVLRLDVYRGDREIHVSIVLGRLDRAPSCDHSSPIPGQGFPPP